MNTVKININNLDVEVPVESTLLEAAEKLNIHIPTLCHLNGKNRQTSCMICVVHEKNSNQLFPSCSMTVAEGMQIETDNDKVRKARKDVLDLLLSEHVGDCEAPCQRACPAHMNIPLMIRQIEEGKFAKALVTVKKDIALPAVLGRICHAPCEKGCNRKYYDSPVSVCSLKRFVADVDLTQNVSYKPVLKEKSGKRIAIFGAGPAGLSAAYYLLQDGHDCFIYDRNSEPGGMLRYGVLEEKLPKSVLDSEIERISELGAKFMMEQSLGKEIGWDELGNDFEAVVLTVGEIDPTVFKNTGLDQTARGLVVNRETFETSISGVFAGGNVLAKARMAIRAAAHGRGIAYSVDQFLSKNIVTGPPKKFNSKMGKIGNDEVSEFLKEAGKYDQVIPQGQGGFKSGYTDLEAKKESSRCFGCDCRKLESCKLRQYSEKYEADQARFKLDKRIKFQKILQHDQVIYEPGKCIKCGLCVQITKEAGEKFGLNFVYRGFDVRVKTPFNEPLSEGLKKTAGECIKACPTAALSWRERSRE